MKRTVDPASVTKNDEENDGFKETSGDENEDAMDIDSEQTPGHPTYGKFDIPDVPIEVTPINSLPPGKNCTFTPMASSIKNGFYALKDVKVVMEQSLMRTRATLSRGDVIRTWRRGKEYDLIVSSLTPAEYGAVSCVNTDLNVDIGPAEGEEGEALAKKSDHGNDAKPEQNPMGGGRVLSEPSSHAKKSNESTPYPTAPTTKAIELPPEPPEDVKEGVCSIQIRGRTASGSSAAGRRRFDIATATMANLFAFGSHVCDGADPSGFRLVTRFPRRVFQLEGSFAPNATLESAGIGQGQEMFMVEMT